MTDDLFMATIDGKEQIGLPSYGIFYYLKDEALASCDMKYNGFSDLINPAIISEGV